MRSLLLVPACEQKLAEALESGADAIVVDIAGAAPPERAEVLAAAGRFRTETRGTGGKPALIVKINPLDWGETDSDLDAVMAAAPDAILLPGSLGAPSVQQLSAKLAVREAQLGLADGATRVVAIVDTARAFFNLGSYRGSSARLIGVAWGPNPCAPRSGPRRTATASALTSAPIVWRGS